MLTSIAENPANDIESAVGWMERALPDAMRRLFAGDDLDAPILQLPLAQLRIAQALYADAPDAADAGETMGRLSERLGVKQNALTQAADRLVNHKLAERLPDSHDRRIVRLRLTKLGSECVAQRRETRRKRLDTILRLLQPEERFEFINAVRTLELVAARMKMLDTVREEK